MLNIRVITIICNPHHTPLTLYPVKSEVLVSPLRYDIETKFQRLLSYFCVQLSLELLRTINIGYNRQSELVNSFLCRKGAEIQLKYFLFVNRHIGIRSSGYIQYCSP
jgi:hypothetical protein